jgi:hypothetical protein
MQDTVEAQTANNSVNVFIHIFREWVLFVACLFPLFNLTGAYAVHNIKEFVNNNYYYYLVWEFKELLSRKFIIPRYKLWMCKFLQEVRPV